MPVTYSLPKGERSNPGYKSQNIGPGQYDPEKKHNLSPPHYKIGSEARGKIIYENVPGAGTYDPKHHQGNPSFS